LADEDPIHLRFELSYVKLCAHRLATIGGSNNEEWRSRIDANKGGRARFAEVTWRFFRPLRRRSCADADLYGSVRKCR
jgi:hypothetical protein